MLKEILCQNQNLWNTLVIFENEKLQSRPTGPVAVRKPDFVAYEQRRHIAACLSTQCLCFLHSLESIIAPKCYLQNLIFKESQPQNTDFD